MSDILQIAVTEDEISAVILMPDEPESNWILATGRWNDDGIWIDTAKWID